MLMKPTKEVLQKLYETERLTTRQIAPRFGVGRAVISGWLKSYGIPLRPANNGLVSRGITPPTKEELHRFIHVERLTYYQIAAKYGVDFTAVPYWRKKHGIAPPLVGKSLSNPGGETLRTLYEAGESTDAIGAKFGVAGVTAASWLKAAGITIRPSGFQWDDHEEPSGDSLRELYESGDSLESIGELFGYSASHIAKFCEKHGINRRPAGFDGGRRYTCDNGEIVLSVYEQRVCNWIHAHSLRYVYEPTLPFGKQTGGRAWRSDFLVNNWYIEVWGVHGRAWAMYQERKKRKVALYQEFGLPLIQLTWKNCTGEALGMDKKLRRCFSPPESDTFTGSQPLFRLLRDDPTGTDPR